MACRGHAWSRRDLKVRALRHQPATRRRVVSRLVVWLTGSAADRTRAFDGAVAGGRPRGWPSDDLRQGRVCESQPDQEIIDDRRDDDAAQPCGDGP